MDRVNNAALQDPGTIALLKKILGGAGGVLRGAFGGNDVRSTPWTPPDLVLDPIKRLIPGLAMGQEMGRRVGGMLGGPNARIGAPGATAPINNPMSDPAIMAAHSGSGVVPEMMPSHATTALVPPASRGKAKKKKLAPRGQQVSKSADAKIPGSVATLQQPNYEGALNIKFGDDDEDKDDVLPSQGLDLAALQGLVPGGMASGVVPQLPQKSNPILRALTLGLKR